MTQIRPIEPEGLKQSPMKKPEIPDARKVEVPAAPEVKSSVEWIDLIRLWIKENLINDILSSQKGEIMQTKSWLFSKTIIGNIILFAWSFIGPMIGIPTLSPELMFTLTLVYNLIIRFFTKSPVVIVDELGAEKPWYFSKTVWTNVLTGVWVFVGPIIGVPVLSPDLMAQILDAANIVLRFFTKSKIS
jgi:hypothetical protein